MKYTEETEGDGKGGGEEEEEVRGGEMRRERKPERDNDGGIGWFTDCNVKHVTQF